MCMVSNVYDYGRGWWDQWNPPQYPQTVPLPFVLTPPPTKQPTLDDLKAFIEEFKKLVAAAEEFDRKTGQPDCEDQQKSAWMREVEERLKKLERSAHNHPLEVPLSGAIPVEGAAK